MRLPAVRYASQYIKMDGGLDLTSPALEMAPGLMRAGSNVEIGINGGIARVAGYEAYSGKTRPSSASYSILVCSISGVSVGDVLTDDATTSYGTVIALPSGQAILTLITGTFSTGNVKVGGVVKGTCTGAQTAGGASTNALNATYLNLAADVYRALIAAVPGSGSILGVHQYNSHVYAFRNNAGGTAAVLHVESASGWTEVAMGEEIAFSNANTSVGDGDTLTQGAVTATIARVVVQTGTLLSGTNTGRLILTGRAGGNFSAGAATSTGGGSLTLGGAQTAITFLPGGRFEFCNINFGGGSGTLKAYGCDGVNRAFEFDGTNVVPIATGMTTDAPKFIKGHKNQLFLSFLSSVQHSSPGEPYVWSAITGAAELGCGDTVTGFTVLPGSETAGALGIKTRNRTLVLYGNDVGDWNLIPYSEEAGGLPYTQQFMGQLVCLDDRGLVTLNATQNYGNFQSGIISDKVTPTITTYLPSAIASCVNRAKNQYRLFFTGGAALYCTFRVNRQGTLGLAGITQVDMPDTVTCVSSAEGATGAEEIYFGSSDGFVYQMDIGTSFDGDPIQWSATLAFNNCGAPRQLKSFTKAVTEVQGSNYAEFSFSYVLGYGSSEFSTPDAITNVSELSSGAAWDSFVWDQFYWDGVALSPNESDITGTAENISLLYSGSSDEFEQFTISGAILHYIPRRAMR